MHFQFGLLIWVMLQGMCFQDVWLNPIPFLFATLLPDSDHRHAPMGRIFPLWLICTHRGFTHTIWGLLVFSLPVWYFMGIKWGVLFASGYFLHLAMDSGTKMGVKWIKGHKKRTYLRTR